MLQKLKLAEDDDTFSQKGWFSCEVREGEIDKECAEKERQKGNQGVPREYLLYSSLMHNFESFALDELTDIKKEKSEEKISYRDEENNEEYFNKSDNIIIEECDYTMEKVYASLFFISFFLLIVIFILYLKKRKSY